MVSPSAPTPRPGASRASGLGGAMVLCVIGAILILVESVALLLAGSAYDFPSWGVFESSLVIVGGLGILVAVLIVAFAILLYALPQHHMVFGVGLLTLSVLSINSGGGVFLGFLLSYVGSLIAIFARPPNVVRTMDPDLAAAAESDPVVEADLLNRGYAPPPTLGPSSP